MKKVKGSTAKKEHTIPRHKQRKSSSVSDRVNDAVKYGTSTNRSGKHIKGMPGIATFQTETPTRNGLLSTSFSSTSLLPGLPPSSRTIPIHKGKHDDVSFPSCPRIIQTVLFPVPVKMRRVDRLGELTPMLIPIKSTDRGQITLNQIPWDYFFDFLSILLALQSPFI